MSTSSFQFKPATREQTPLLIGLVGPSGSGKTFSALRLATGIQRIVGGEIAFIDTEARRALHYANKFKFQHLSFDPPHSPERYLEALKAAVAIGAKTIVVDSMSHEHEGEGGVLEQHESELDRLAGDNWSKREAVNFLAWAKPKAQRRRLINSLLQMNCNFVFCFRAKEKIKLVKDEKGKNKPVQMGWQAIAGDEFVFEMTNRFLLPPGAGGVPDFSREAWEGGVPKMPEEHEILITEGQPLDEGVGAALAQWAIGFAPPPTATEDKFDVSSIEKDFAKIGVPWEQVREHFGGRDPAQGDRKQLASFYRARKSAHQAASRASEENGGQAGVDEEVRTV